MNIRKTYSLLATIVLLGSCNTKNELCVCIEKGDALNQFSSELLATELVTKEQEEKLEQLRNEVNQACATFKDMGPKELYELRNECGNFPEP